MMTKKTLYLEHTTVPASKTIGEITSLLVQAGAAEISTTYVQGEPAGVRWRMELYGQPAWFEMPVKIDAVFKVMYARKPRQAQTTIEELKTKALRIAWRQLLAWTQLQLAMIQIGMAEFGQVFLAYTVGQDNQTVWEVFKQQQYKQLPAPSQKQ